MAHSGPCRQGRPVSRPRAWNVPALFLDSLVTWAVKDTLLLIFFQE